MSFTYSSCIREGRLHALVAKEPLFGQDPSFATDLVHVDDPRNPQFWLNFFIDMYPNDTKDFRKRPRLPPCASMGSLLPYVRWANVAALFSLLAALVLVVALPGTLRRRRRVA